MLVCHATLAVGGASGIALPWRSGPKFNPKSTFKFISAILRAFFHLDSQSQKFELAAFSWAMMVHGTGAGPKGMLGKQKESEHMVVVLVGGGQHGVP